MKKLALFDIDGTIMPKGFGIFVVAEKLAEENLINPLSPQMMHQAKQDYRDKKLSYEKYSLTVMENFTKGLDSFKQTEVEKRATEIVLELEDKFYAFAKNMIPVLNNTHDVYFITANADFYAKAFTDYYHAKGFKATLLEVKDGRYTGNLEKSLAMAEEKKAVIQDLIRSYPEEGSMAFGDADADRFMLGHVDHAICIDPTDNLAKEAKEKNWIITDPEHAEEIIKKIL